MQRTKNGVHLNRGMVRARFSIVLHDSNAAVFRVKNIALQNPNVHFLQRTFKAKFSRGERTERREEQQRRGTMMTTPRKLLPSHQEESCCFFIVTIGSSTSSCIILATTSSSTSAKTNENYYGDSPIFLARLRAKSMSMHEIR